MEYAQTVTGPLAGDALGVTLVHEHVLIDLSCRYVPAPDEDGAGELPSLRERWRVVRAPSGFRANVDGTSRASAVEELGAFAAAGGRTVVDLSCIGLGGDAAGLRAVAEATGVNIVAATGTYVDESLPEWVRRAPWTSSPIGSRTTSRPEGARGSGGGSSARSGSRRRPRSSSRRCGPGRVRGAPRRQSRPAAPVRPPPNLNIPHPPARRARRETLRARRR